MRFDWDSVRRDDDSLDLVKAFHMVVPLEVAEYEHNHVRACNTLRDLEALCPIRSRQVASLAIIMVAALGGTAERIDVLQDGLQLAADAVEEDDTYTFIQGLTKAATRDLSVLEE